MRNLIFNLLVSIIPFFLCSCNDNTFEIHDGHWHLMKDNNGKEEDFVEEIPVNIYSSLVYSGYYRGKRHAIGEVIPGTKVIYLTLSGSIDSFEINFIENDSFALTSMRTGEVFSLTSVLDDFDHKEIDYINDKRVDFKFRENECEDKFSPSIYDLEIIIGANQMDPSPYYLTVVEGEIINYLDPNKLKSIIEMKKVTLAEGSRDLIQPVIYLDDKLSYYCEVDVQNFFQSQGFNNVKTVSRNISNSKFSLCSRAYRIADLDYTSHYISSLDNVYKAVIDDKVLVTFIRNTDLNSQDRDSLNYGTYYLFHNDNESDTKNLDNLVVSNSKKFSEWRRSDFSQKIVQLNLYTKYYRLWNGMRVGDKIHRYYDLIDFSREENRNKLLYFDSTYKYEIYLDEGVISRMKITVESTHI